jgi:hypothetical protein
VNLNLYGNHLLSSLFVIIFIFIKIKETSPLKEAWFVDAVSYNLFKKYQKASFIELSAK